MDESVSDTQHVAYSYIHHWYLVQCPTPHGCRINGCKIAKLSSHVSLCSGYPDRAWQTEGARVSVIST